MKLFEGDVYSIHKSRETKLSDSFFEIYPRLLLAHRLIKSNHAETFHSKLFPSVSRWPENLKVLLFLNVSQFLGVRGIGVRRLEITVISRFAIICLLSNGRDPTPVSPSPPSFKCFNPSSLRGTTRPALFPRMSLGRPRKLFTFVYLKFDICGPVCSNRRCGTTAEERAVVTKGVKKEKGSKKKGARQGPRVI